MHLIRFTAGETKINEDEGITKEKMMESLPVKTRWCEPVFSFTSLISRAINPGNEAREDQRRNLNGDKRKVAALEL